ncbi:MAG: hypothetical protein FWC19_06725 [Treponema sp.]|nr:hypothetical protein [Treponema sp.]MCL2272479.1 hypothetical protein [Treponema sp.]
MKKNLILFLTCLIIPSGIWSLQIGDRFFEIGFDAGVNFSNDFLSASDIFQEIFILDLNKLETGFHLNAGADIIPFFFKFDSKKGWGFGLSVKAQATGLFDLSGKMLTFSENISSNGNKEGNSEINGALFGEAAIPVYFSYRKFKIKVMPSLYYPVAYATSDIAYNFNETTGGTIFNLGYNVDIYTAVPMESAGDAAISATPGVDLSIGVEFPLSEALGISDFLFFLDFDIGLELSNIPIAAGTMTDYMKMKGSIGSEEPVSLFGEDGDLGNFFNINDTEYLNEKINVYRPFKMLLFAAWRPLGNNLLTLTPSFGFAHSPMYNEKISMEAGVKGRLNLFNLLILTLGTGYHDRLWKHGFNIALNSRAVEFNIGAALCSPGFAKSWSGSGFNINAGLKFGW